MHVTWDFSHYVRAAGEGIRHIDLAVEGVHCAGCMAKIERGLSAIPDVTLARVNLTDRRVALEWKAGTLDPSRFIDRLEELGYKGFDAVQWYGIVGPAKLPPDITQRLSGEINKALAQPALQQRLANEAIDSMPMTPEQFGGFIQSEIERYRKLAKERNISLDD